MNEVCHVCEHAKTQAIAAALSSGRALGVVCAQYRLKKQDVIKHLKHMMASERTDNTAFERTAPAEVALTQATAKTRPYIMTYPEFEVTVQLDDDRLGAANFQRQTVREIRDRWNLLDRAHQEEVVQWLRGRLTDALYEV